MAWMKGMTRVLLLYNGHQICKLNYCNYKLINIVLQTNERMTRAHTHKARGPTRHMAAFIIFLS